MNYQYKSLFNRLARNFSIGFLGSLLVAIIGVGRTAVLTKTVSIETVGKIFIILNLFDLLSTFLSVRVNDLLLRFYPQFSKEKNKNQLLGLLYISILLCLAVGIVTCCGVFFTANWFSEKFYHDPTLSHAFRIYAPTMLFLSFQGYYATILRLHDRFSAVVIPQVIGVSVTFILLLIYIFLWERGIRLEGIVLIYTIGAIVRSLIPLVISLRESLFAMNGLWRQGIFNSLKPYRTQLLSNLFHTNLVGYLKIASDTGGFFLLGILSTPSQMAYFGIAKQLATLLKMIKNNFQNAIAPEITYLWSESHLSQLFSLLKRIVLHSTVWGGLFILPILIFIKPLLLLITTNDYFNAIPTIYLLIVATYINFITTAFYPLTVAMDYMPRRNFVVSFRLLFLGLGIFYGLNAIVLALVHVTGVIFIRIFADFPLMCRLKQATHKNP